MKLTPLAAPLFFALPILGAMGLWNADAHACSPVSGESGVLVVAGSRNGMPRVPRDQGIVLTAHVGILTDDVFLRGLRVTAHQGSAVFEGSIKRVYKDEHTSEAAWLWTPDTPLPLGEVDVELEFGAIKTDTTRVLVEDRTLESPDVRLLVNVRKGLAGDRAGPTATCQDMSSMCGNSGGKLPATAVGVPWVSSTIASDKPFDEAYFRLEESISVAGVGKDLWGARARAGGEVPVSAEYCASLTIVPLVGAAAPVRTTSCVPHGDLDLSVSAADQESWRKDLGDCEFPASAFLAASGLGTPPSSGGDGCSSSPTAPWLPVVPILTVVMFAGVRRRRGARYSRRT